jgi:hypothetical protein
MNAQQIRAEFARACTQTDPQIRSDSHHVTNKLLCEIAAQLAEVNHKRTTEEEGRLTGEIATRVANQFNIHDDMNTLIRTIGAAVRNF